MSVWVISKVKKLACVLLENKIERKKSPQLSFNSSTSAEIVFQSETYFTSQSMAWFIRLTIVCRFRQKKKRFTKRESLEMPEREELEAILFYDEIKIMFYRVVFRGT